MSRNPNIKFSREKPEYEKEILDIARVTRIVAGGRRFSFRATVAIGNEQGLVGLGVANGKDVSQAINKAYKKAQKGMVTVIREKGTIPIDIIGHFKSARVLLRPAREGRGLIAGGTVRALCKLAGIENISAKILSKSNNKLNIARATLKAFQKINQYSLKKEEKQKKQPEAKKIAKKKQVEKKSQPKTSKQTKKAKS